MSKPVRIQKVGSQLFVINDDGYRRLAIPTSGDIWVVEQDPGDSPAPATPPPPPTGGYAVIFPCAVHNVSDSFADHVARGSVNPGTDYTAAYGSPVWAVSAGVVTDADSSTAGGGGRTIHIDNDDGNGADYLHLSSIGVSVGDHVTQGQQIGLSGASGFGQEHYYGAHLHISYRPNHTHGYTNSGNIDFDNVVRSEGLT